MKRRIFFLLLILLTGNLQSQSLKFKYIRIDTAVALHPQIADIDRDGINDIVAVSEYTNDSITDGSNIKEVCWYKSPSFKKMHVGSIIYRACEMAISDIDGDGWADIIGAFDEDGNDLNGNGGLVWFRNPAAEQGNWTKYIIGSSSYPKDINTGDFNGDGKMDIVARALDAKIHVFYQLLPGHWSRKTIPVTTHDGLAVADIDRDGDLDLALNGYWLQNPGKDTAASWSRFEFASKWHSQKSGINGEEQWYDNNTKVVAYDMNNDGRIDILISNSENKGFPVAWYEAPLKPYENNWNEHIVGYMDNCHTLRVGDMDNDGDADVVSGSLIVWEEKESPDQLNHPVVVFINKGNGINWEREVISNSGCYGGNIGDIDGDGDLDIIAPKTFYLPPLQVWINQLINK